MVPHVSAPIFLKMLEFLCLDDFVLEDDMDESSWKELGDLADKFIYLLEGLRILCEWEEERFPHVMLRGNFLPIWGTTRVGGGGSGVLVTGWNVIVYGTAEIIACGEKT